MSALENARRQIILHQRSLQILKEQQAKLGIYTPPNIIIDIEDTEAAIAELQETLAELEKTGGDTDTIVPAAQRRAQIYLEGNFATVSADVKQAAIDAFAAVMGISPEEVKLFGVAAGSIIFDIGIPPRGTERLKAQLQRNSAQLRILKVQRVSIVIPGGAAQTWRYEDGKFQLHETPLSPPPEPGFIKKLLSFIRSIVLLSAVVAGGWWGYNTLNPPDLPTPVPPPTKTVRPISPTRTPTATPTFTPTPRLVEKIALGLPNGCNQRYLAGSKTQIFIESNVFSGVLIQLDGKELFGMDISPEETAIRDWVLPEKVGEYTLRATLDSGVWADCLISVYQRAAAVPSMTTEYDIDRMGMDIDNGFPALIDPDDTRGMEAYLEYCRTKCLENTECRAYTFLKEKNWCYLKFDVPDPVGNDCCVSGVKINP